MQHYADHDHDALQKKAKPAAQPQAANQPLTNTAHILQLQRTHGNAYVRRMLQRQEETAAPAASGGAAGPTSIGDGTASITAAGGIVTINAAMVNVNAPMTNHSGIDKSDTVITNNVVASSYTPGAGNVW